MVGRLGVGNGIGIPFRNKVNGGGGNSLPPELKEALCGVWIADQNTNESPTRNIIKNKLKDRGGDFEILNAAYKGNSGYGKYNYDYTTWKYNKALVNILSNKKVECFAVAGAVGFYTTQTNTYVGKIKITGLTESIELGQVDRFQIYGSDGTPFVIKTDGIFDINVTFGTDIVYMYVVPKGNYSGNLDSPIYIEQVPKYQGAFCTDGVDDMIVSQKPVNEMLGGSNEVTVVSMIHQIDENITSIRTNFIGILNAQNYWLDNLTSKNGINKTGIYGYTYDGNVINTINNVLGDYKDYSSRQSNDRTTNAEFSVEGFRYTLGLSAVSQVAWYWTFIAKRVLTTDEINQVIAYYNLDKYVAPDIYYDVKKQGLTNENHAEFGDKLIDYSGNGKDMQLYNFGWKGNSGIGKYNFSNINVLPNRFEGTVTTNKCHFTKKLTNTTNNFCDLIVISPNEPIKFKVSGLSDGRKLFIANRSGSGSNYNFDNGEHEISLSFGEGVTQNNPFGVTGDVGDIDVTVEFIPSYAGALVFDGVDDYGKVEELPVYKDYTVIVDRDWITFNKYQNLVYKGQSNIFGSYAFEMLATNENGYTTWSFDRNNIVHLHDKNITYQTKYSYNGNQINAGTGTDGDLIYLGRSRDSYPYYANVVIRSLMSFPYSLSEFLIERQLKKRKLGTLHPETNKK